MSGRAGDGHAEPGRPQAAVGVRAPAVGVGVAVLVALVVGLVPGPAPVLRGAAPVASAAPAASVAPCPRPDVRPSLRPAGPVPAPGTPGLGADVDAVLARGRLVVAVDQGKYLTGYRDPATGDLAGTDIDVARSIAAAMFGDAGRVQFVVTNIADRETVLRTNPTVDMVINDFTVTCERQRAIEFSTPYRMASARLLVRRDSGIQDVGGLAGRPVCTSLGSTTADILAAVSPRPRVVVRPGIPDCAVDLQLGRVAAVASDDGILAGLAAQDPQTAIVGPALASARYAVGMRPEQPDLVRFVNAVLERGRADGSLAASHQRWFGGHLDPVPAVAPAEYRD